MLMNRAFQVSQSQKRRRQQADKRKQEQQRASKQAAARPRPRPYRATGGLGAAYLTHQPLGPPYVETYHFPLKPDGFFNFECYTSGKEKQAISDYHMQLFKVEVNCRALPRVRSSFLAILIRILSCLILASSFISYMIVGIIELANYTVQTESPFTWRSKPFTHSDFPNKSLAGQRIAEFIICLLILFITGICQMIWIYSSLTSFENRMKVRRRNYLEEICSKYSSIFSQVSGRNIRFSADRGEAGIYMKIEDPK